MAGGSEMNTILYSGTIGVHDSHFYGGDIPLYLLMIYAKACRDDLSPDAQRAVQALAARLKNAQRR